MAQTRLLGVLQAAIAAARAGDRAAARALLGEVTRGEPDNEVAWLWLASVAETPEEAVGHLQRVLAMNPANERARQGLAHFLGRGGPDPTPAPPAWHCPLCQASAPQRHDRCPACRAILTLADPDAFLDHDADEKALAGAVARLSARLGRGDDPATHRGLALAQLHLGNFEEALRHFREALRLEPDPTLKDQVSALPRRRKALRGLRRPRVPARPARPRTILVVDDSPTIRRVVTLALERRGHRVLSAADGSEALERLRDAAAPDLVLLDINMPGPDGYQVCRRLREGAGTAGVPVVMLSGRDGFFSKVRGRAAGCAGFIGKPFKLDDLLGAVEAYCGG
jgi:twitching motility two-component system response regulator PilG